MNRLLLLACIFSQFISLSLGWKHCDVFCILHFREVGSKKYIFYLENKNLKAALVDGIGEVCEMPIAGIPDYLIKSLNPHQVNGITKLLNESFFSVQFGKIHINARGQGGWGDLQHKGYGDELVFKWYSPAEGTYIWAQDIFELFSNRAQRSTSRAAMIVADACASVDTEPETNSVKLSNLDVNGAAQKWHFNTNECASGTENDIRMSIATSQLELALNTFYAGNDDLALRELGRGLHPLQDMFAHTDAFVTLYSFFDDSFGNDRTFLGHLGYKGKGADNPYYIKPCKYSYATCVKADSSVIDKNRFQRAVLSQRYSDAKTASYIYLYCYALLTVANFDENGAVFNMIMERLDESVLAYGNKDANGNILDASYVENSPRGTHTIYNFINVLKSKFRYLEESDCSDENVNSLFYKNIGLSGLRGKLGQLSEIFAKNTASMQPLDVDIPIILDPTNLGELIGSIIRKWLCCDDKLDRKNVKAYVKNSEVPNIVEGNGEETVQNMSIE